VIAAQQKASLFDPILCFNLQGFVNPERIFSMSRENMKPNPPLEMKLCVLSAVDYAPADYTRERIKSVSQRTFRDEYSAHDYQLTWRTIESWSYSFKKHGITSMDMQTRSDKNAYRKVQLNELAKAINDILPTLRFNNTSSGVLI
jgi:hypothetical protein